MNKNSNRNSYDACMRNDVKKANKHVILPGS